MCLLAGKTTYIETLDLQLVRRMVIFDMYKLFQPRRSPGGCTIWVVSIDQESTGAKQVSPPFRPECHEGPQ